MIFQGFQNQAKKYPRGDETFQGVSGVFPGRILFSVFFRCFQRVCGHPPVIDIYLIAGFQYLWYLNPEQSSFLQLSRETSWKSHPEFFIPSVFYNIYCQHNKEQCTIKPVDTPMTFLTQRKSRRNEYCWFWSRDQIF